MWQIIKTEQINLDTNKYNNIWYVTTHITWFKCIRRLHGPGLWLSIWKEPKTVKTHPWRCWWIPWKQLHTLYLRSGIDIATTHDTLNVIRSDPMRFKQISETIVPVDRNIQETHFCLTFLFIHPDISRWLLNSLHNIDVFFGICRTYFLIYYLQFDLQLQLNYIVFVTDKISYKLCPW